MASVRVLKTLVMGKGQTMDITVNESEPEDSVNRYVMDTHCTGEEALEIPPHWHKNHQEYLSVIEGRVEMTLDGRTRILNAGDPEVLVPRLTVHSVKGFKGEKLIFREKPDPAGLYKASNACLTTCTSCASRFFNDVFFYGGFGGIWHTLRAFYDGDAYLALPLGSRLLDQVFVSVFGGIAHLFVARKPETL